MKFKRDTTDYLLFVTTPIFGKTDNGDDIAGTGFFYSSRRGVDDILTLIVTNRHVVELIRSGELVMHLCADDDKYAPSGKFLPLRLNDFRAPWVMHPNPDVDLCAAPLDEVYRLSGIDENDTFIVTLSSDHVPSDADLSVLSAIESVIMIGYPMALWDETNNLPIIRRGTTASHVAVDFRGKPEGVIDMACFMGSSGSPILLYHETGSVIRAQAQDFAVRNRPILIGILSHTFTMESKGKISLKNIAKSKMTEFKFASALHLGVYCKSKELIPLADEVARKIGRK